jgi:cytochrome b
MSTIAPSSLLRLVNYSCDQPLQAGFAGALQEIVMATVAARFSPRSIRVWDLPLRLFHWTLVIAIAVAFLSSEEDSALNQWHVMSGWVVAVLLVFRVAWGFVGGEHSRFVDFIRPSQIGHHVSGLLGGKRDASLGHNPLGALAVIVLLALAGVVVWAGAFGGPAAEELHETVAWTLLAFVGVHIAAVLVMSLLERENLVRAMVTGRKPAERHPDAPDARGPSALGIVLAGLVVAGTVYAILQYDPQAFTARSAESFEHRGSAGGQQAYGEHVSERDDD